MTNSNVTFTNLSRVIDAPNDFSEKQIKQFITEHPSAFEGEIRVTFFQTGVSSLVCKIMTDTKSYVLKVALRNKPIDESIFLEIWSKAGVLVPHIYEKGFLYGKSYFLLEYIDAHLLSEHYAPKELVKENIYFEMGRTLKIMHKPIAQGFGRPKDGRGQYETFGEWLTKGEDIIEALEYVRKNDLYSAHSSLINESVKNLLQALESNLKSSFCHDDYSIENIFATTPLTIFDPNPKYNNGLMDLGRSITSIISYGYESDLEEKAIQQIIDGYSLNEEDAYSTIKAAVILGIIWKSPYPHRTGNFKVIDFFEQYLCEGC